MEKSYTGKFLPWILVLISVFTSIVSPSQKLSAVLRTQWPQTPFVLEAAEFLAEGDTPDDFWRLADDFETVESSGVKRSSYEAVINTVNKFLDTNSSQSLLRMSLSLRSYSPKVEMFREMGRNRGLSSLPSSCAAVLDLGPDSDFLCDPKELTEEVLANARNSEKPVDVDHVYPVTSDPREESPTTVILYGEIGTPSFKAFHNILKELASNRRIRYILRHWTPSVETDDGGLFLSGFGVELQIKSTEYKAQDDSKVDGGSGHSLTGEQDEEAVQGFYFQKLKSKNPNLTEKLEHLRSHVIDSMREVPELKVWQLQDLSLQAASRIMAAPREESLSLLMSLSQDFPKHAYSLSRVKVDPDLKKEVQLNNKFLENRYSIDKEDGYLDINGMPFDLDTTSVFALFDELKSERKRMAALHSHGLSGAVLSSLLALDFNQKSREPSTGVDIRGNEILYFNDIESDAIYKGWNRQLIELLRPTMYPGMLRTVRRNIFHLVFILDPTKETSIPLMKLAESFYVHHFPLRIGAVFLPADEASYGKKGTEDASVAMLQAIEHLAASGGQKALSFITDLYQLNGNREVTVGDVTAALKAMKLDVDAILDVPYNDEKYHWRDFAASRALIAPKVLMNGVPIQKLSKDEFEDGVLIELSTQLQKIQRSVYDEELKDDDDILTYLMEQPHIVPRLNDRILSARNGPWGLPPSFSFKDVVYVKSHPKRVPVLTLWVVGDVDTSSQAAGVMAAALDYASETVTPVRIGLLSSSADPGPLTKAFMAASKVCGDRSGSCLEYLSSVFKAGIGSDVFAPLKEHDLDLLSFNNAFNSPLTVDLRAAEYYLKGASKTGVMIVANSLQIGPLRASEEFKPDDFILLENLVNKGSADKILECTEAVYDLDNIRLEEIPTDVFASFQLAYLLLEGHCFEASSGSPPRGLEVTLGSTREPEAFDTIVMANLGYFQLKARPGVWSLRIREGRSLDLYRIVDDNGLPMEKEVLISSFKSNVEKLRVSKREGKEKEELLVTDESSEDEEEANGIWGSITNTIGFGGKKDVVGKDGSSDDVINVFSVASGHLYERLLRIMMLSVLKHTKTPVKFWFLKNYLSPTFKKLLPPMAEKYGFDYALVEYKWPVWLHQQTEKQRIIWGYKILFLDVLFPLSVKKIIFVDADQIVAIKSLPQEWLWCETWCSDESKTSAKTIDLCNNPKTKEAKLHAATRIVAEWKDYDEELKSFISDTRRNQRESEKQERDSLRDEL
ncbi:unnamed protein product [Cyprideis torosa]|uniref:Uncharacterized protein n=1 Tax=Cyprideis torosa TaxID=163714 RepID=A0A7R8W9F5_9CRUS|nr:unnamed protein product [Cyprideis torosa]CAG0885304.1 unnamed protein product [Cyprideis torosa]